MKIRTNGKKPLFRLFVIGITLFAAASMVRSADVIIDNINLPDSFLPDSGTKFQGTAIDTKNKKKIDLQDPPNLERKVDYDPDTKMYTNDMNHKKTNLIIGNNALVNLH